MRAVMMMADRQVRIIISGEAASLIRAAGQAEGALRRVGDSGRRAGEDSNSFSENLKKAAAAAGVVTGFAAVAGAIKYVVAQGTAFQDNMNSLQAVTGASAGQMDRLSGVARSLGKDIDLPATSAGDAAEAMLELAKGGLSVNQSMAAAKGTLLLAAAAQVSGAQAAEIQANALNAFALSGDQANHVADVLANTANAASGEITDFAAGLQQSATVAHAFGIGIEDSATTLGLFAKAGLSGSDAGTSFKTMLTALASPTKQQQIALDELNLTVYDAQGNFVGMKSITEQLAAAKGHLTQQEYNAAASTAFGSDAIRAANILAEGGVGAWNNMAEAVGKAGGAQELAAAKTQGVSGAFGKMMSAIEDVSLSLFNDFAPALEGALNFAAGLVGVIGDVVTWVGNLPGPVLAGATAFGTFLLLRGPMNALFLQAIAGYTRMGIAVTGAAGAARASVTSFAAFGAAAKGALAFLGGPLGIALTAGAVALSFFAGSSDEASGSTADFTGAIDENTGALSANAPAVIAAASAKSGAFAAYKAIGGSVKEYTDALLGNTSAQDELHTRLLDTATAAISGSKEWGRYVASGQSAGKSARETASDILASGDAGIFASDGLSAAMNASSLYASESDKLGTEATQTNDVLAATGGVTKGVGDAAAAAAPSMEELSKKLEMAADNAQFLADNTEGAMALSAVAAAASDASRALDIFKIAMDNADGRVRSLDEATANQNATLRALEGALKDGTKAATENSEAGDLNVQALQNWDVAALTATESGGKVFDEMNRMADQYAETTQAAYSNTAATGDLSKANADARAAATQSRAAFVSLMTQYLGGNVPAAEALADKLGILDGQKIDNKTFQTINDDAVAQQKLRDAKAAVIADKNFAINAQDNATGVVQGIQRVVNSLTGKSVVIETIRQEVVRGTVLATPFAGGAVNDYVAAAKSKAAGFWGGGKLPGTPPSDPTVDNIPAIGPGGTPFRVRSNEWVISEPASKYYGDARMDAINNMTYPRLPQGTVSSGSGGSQPINLVLTLLGDGPITEAALGAAQVTVDGAMQQFALTVKRGMGQS
jgi:TP901 family phage tail tape measure protein